MLICGKTRFGVCTATKLLNGAFTRKYRDRVYKNMCVYVRVATQCISRSYIHVDIIS